MVPHIPRLVLHVGIHKTGTTTLQVALDSLRGQLAAKGIALVTIEQMKQLPHERAWKARRTTNPAETPFFRKELSELVSREIETVVAATGEPVRQLLISNERMVGARMPSEGDTPVFRPVAVPSTRQIIEILNPDSTHVAIYTRRQDRLIESCYLWEIQKGLSHTVHKQFPYLDEPVLHYFDLVRRLQSIPEVGSIRVRPFEMIRAGSLAYLDDFLINLDMQGALDFSEFDTNPAENLSYSQRALDIALTINSSLDTKKQRDAVRRFLKRQFTVDDYGPARIITDEERADMIDMYRPDNERLFATYMPDLPVESYSSEENTKALGKVLTPITA
ncbi:hypothetical protein ACFLRH_01645 [Actinomycetota bacterium]